MSKTLADEKFVLQTELGILLSDNALFEKCRMKTRLFPIPAYLLFTVATTTCHAALLSYEGFDYPPGSSIVGQNGGLGFSQAWQLNSSGGVLTNQGYSLGYTDPQGNRLVTAGGSVFLQGATSQDVATQPNRLLSYSRGTNSG